MTVISKDVKSHQQALSSLVLKAIDICFELQSPKCISLYFNGHRMLSSTVFSMVAGNTINICNVDCTKFLGCTIGVSPTIARSVASANKFYNFYNPSISVLFGENIRYGS